jgi:hypothetical protein
MAKQFKKRERFKNLEVVRRLRCCRKRGSYYRVSANWWCPPAHDDWFEQDRKHHEDYLWSKRKLEKSVYKGICRFSREFFHPIWRKAGKRVCQLHLLGEDARADNLDPQPKRLGIMWYVD